DGSVSLENVPAYVHRDGVTVEVPGVGAVRGDVAWGGNWFFLTELEGAELSLSRVRELTQATMAIRGALAPASRARAAPWSITSSCSGRRRVPTRTAGISCCVRVWRTTGRRAAPAHRRRWRPCTHAARCARARRGGRRASPGVSSRAGWTNLEGGRGAG